MEIRKFDNRGEFVQSSVEFLEEACLENKGNIRIGLSGGSTPRPVYEALSHSGVMDFKRVSFYQVDERHVPADNEDSNQRMIREALVQPLEGRLANFFAFDTSLDWNACAAQYDEVLKESADPFDVMVLGMGTDGHTASIFPMSPLLAERTLHAATAETSEFAVRERLTMTFGIILQSRHLLLLLKGANKEEALRELTEGNKSILEFPARALLAHPRLTIHFLNE